MSKPKDLNIPMKEHLIPRILRDVTDGVMVLDMQGTIKFLNPSGGKILGTEADSLTGKKYAILMNDDSKKENDHFHQFLLDAVYDKEHVHEGNVIYVRPDGRSLELHINTSFLYDDSGNLRDGIVIQFSDVTELVTLQRKQKEASIVFAATIACVCIWVFLYVLWELCNRPISNHWMTQLVQLNGVVIFLFVLKNTSFTLRDMGFGTKNLKKIIITDSCIAVIGFVLLVGAKLLVMQFVPGFFDESKPFWNWKAMGTSEWLYPLTVLLQEFLTRGVMHENLRRIFTGKHRESLAIIISSLIFGVLHIHMGIVYMAGAAILLGGLGMLYRKQNTIWGLCIPHYVLGISLVFLGWVQ
ncbi:MAG: PAS domain S-box protein [bacterium]|nr:PAS domain S-box protein [bacterium]